MKTLLNFLKRLFSSRTADDAGAVAHRGYAGLCSPTQHHEHPPQH